MVQSDGPSQRRILAILLSLLVLAGASLATSGQTNYQRLKSFDGPSGRSPASGLIEGSDGLSALYTTEPTILTYVPGSAELGALEYRPGPPSSRWYNAVASDNNSNPIFAGGYKSEAFWRSVSQCLIEKRSPDLNQTWSTTHPAGYFAAARSVTVDRRSNIIVLCSHGVTKYSPDGKMLWQVQEEVSTLRVDRSGNTFYSNRFLTSSASKRRLSQSLIRTAGARGK